VVVLDDGSAGSEPALPQGVTVIHGDVGDVATTKRIARAEGVREIVHFAGLICVGESVQQPARYFDVNFVRALHLLEVARDESIERFVFSSTAAVYGEPEEVPIRERSRRDPVNPYGAAKLAFEHALDAFEKAHGIRYAAPRYFNAAGAHPSGKLREAHDPETHLIPLVLDAALGRRKPVTIFGTDYETPDGTCIRDYIHVDDLASAHLSALDRLENGSRIGAVNLGTGHGSSVREIVDETSRLLGKPVPHDMGPRRAGDPSRLVADPTRARDVLGWSPRRSDIHVIVEDALRSRMRS
jgi:UDP-glucose-4-epimerase GalE